MAAPPRDQWHFHLVGVGVRDCLMHYCTGPARAFPTRQPQSRIGSLRAKWSFAIFRSEEAILRSKSQAENIFTSNLISIATMAAIGSLVFCTDCGNLLENNTSRKTYLNCEVCGAQNKGMPERQTKE
jgi:hypothetical protein